MFSESENRKNINESGLDKFFELLVNLTASEDNSIFIIDYMLNMYQRKKKDTTKLGEAKKSLLSETGMSDSMEEEHVKKKP